MQKLIKLALRVIDVIAAAAIVIGGLVILAAEWLATPGARSAFLSDRLEEVILTLFAVVLYGGARVLIGLNWIQDEMAADDFRTIADRIRGLRGPREALVVPQLMGALMRVEGFFKDGVLRLEGMRAFQDFWVAAVSSHPGADILATSLPSTNYFWNANDVHHAMRENIKAGGFVRRLFFIQGDAPTPHELAVMRAQEELGVYVYYCNRNDLSAEQRELYLVERSLRYGWRAQTSTEDVTLAEVYTSEAELRRIRDRLDALFARLDLIHPLTPERETPKRAQTPAESSRGAG